MNEKHQKVPDESRKGDQLGLTLGLMHVPAPAIRGVRHYSP
jgi:hypothetical protein